MLLAMSLLALLGLRYPVKMLPILLFESMWKLTWFAVVALPQLVGDRMDAATTELFANILWVVIILAVIPWGFVARSTWPLPVTAGAQRRPRARIPGQNTADRRGACGTTVGGVAARDGLAPQRRFRPKAAALRDLWCRGRSVSLAGGGMPRFTELWR
jgi:hypothetical protein